MAGRVPAVGPDGAPITLPIEKVPELEASGGHVITPGEAAASESEAARRSAGDTLGGAVKDYAESSLAGVHALQRGTLEAVGVPLDRGITGVADFIGGPSARKSTADYLKGLDERHPLLTAATGLEGNVAGAIGAAAALKAPGAIGAAPIAGARGVAARAAVGGVENVIQATTKDVNEAALGDKAVNGEALVASLPNRFVVGALLTGAFEGGAHVLGKGARAVTSRAVPALEEKASGAIGRELGLEGEEAVAAGSRVRGLNGGEVPTSKRGLADILTGEQATLRAGAEAEAAGAADALAGAQTSEAALLSARQEAARKAAAGAGKRGVAQAEGEAGMEVWEAAARQDAKMAEAGGLASAERGAARTAHETAGAEALTAGDRVVEARAAKESGVAAAIADVERRYGAVHQTLSAERAEAARSLEEIAREHEAATKDLQAAIKRIGETQGNVSRGASKADLIEYAAARKRGENPPRPVVSGAKMQYAQRAPRVGDINDATGEVWTKESIAAHAEERATETGSLAVTAEAARLTKLQQSLADARLHAETHLSAVDEAINANKIEARKTVNAARSAAVETLTPPIENASKRSGHAMSALEAAQKRVKEVEAETAGYVEAARASGEGAVAKAEKRGAARIASAKADAAEALKKFEAGAASEKASLAKTHEAQAKALPPASRETSVDTLIRGMTDRQAAMGSRPLVSGHAAMGAGLSLLHGNPVAAGGALASSFVAGQARNHGNITAARMLRSLSTTLTSVDTAIREGATSILTGTASKTMRAATNEDTEKKGEPTFEELSSQLIALQGNPMELEHRVQEAVGHIALDAPGTYQEMLLTTQRAHQFLLSILPAPQRDPNSLTPHLESSDVSPTARYEFMQSARTIGAPLSVFSDVEDGSITQLQVDAIQAVYPKLFDGMRNEVRRQTMYLTTPVDYERSIHVGTLLGQVTTEVLEPDFQALMRTSYEDKSKKNESANASGGSNSPSGSKAVKNMMSASESIEGGSP